MHYLLYFGHLPWQKKVKFAPYIIHIGGRVYPVRHYPIAIRLRDREGRAILCIALNPRSGDSLGAILGVRSVALLHAKCSPYAGRIFCCTSDICLG